MKRPIWTYCVVLALATVIKPAAGFGFERALELTSGQQLADRQLVAVLKRQSVVLVGEHHNNAAHHAAQLKIIRMLHESGTRLAIGMEMFRQDSQAVLDHWTAGTIPESEFKRAYLDNWNYDWSLYRPIFEYARQEQIPVVGLNVSRSVTRQVARHGFDSLSRAQKAELGQVSCDITGAYRDFVGRAHGGHGHGGMNFEFFCEAQLVWDTAMAVGVINHLADHPGRVMVVLAGGGHARKPGIPAQIRKRTDLPLTVLLPEAPGSMDPQTVNNADADFLLLTK